ncbi:hypothetical protein DN34_3578 [Vibrio cholerae]|nr:hypothetical protein DN34_3578 [Vibrio cholerae]
MQVSDNFAGGGFPVGWQFARYAAFVFSGFCWVSFRVSGEFLIPSGFFACACLFCIPRSINVRRDFKRSVFPTQEFTRGFDFIVAQRRAVTVV